MSADKRSVSTDALETLGTIIGPEEARDAIHLAVENVVAGQILRPGDHIGFLADGTVGTSAKKLLGIVDPFIERNVKPGERFWLVVYPRQIKSLRHVWTHPDFPESADLPKPQAVPAPVVEAPQIELTVSEAVDDALDRARIWIQDYCDDMNIEYDDLMWHTEAHLRNNWHYWAEGEKFEGEWLPEEFWDHCETLTGKRGSGSFFSCSC